MQKDSPAEIVAISSQVVRGSVGNRAIVFALEIRGHPVWSLPTVVMPWHPGHGPSTRMVPVTEAFSGALKDIAASPRARAVGAIITGYFADALQVHAAADFIKTMKSANPQTVYLCDPVIGDLGGLYVSTDVAEAIRDQLVPLADIATPNRHELGWLCGTELESNAEILEAALSLGPRHMLVTSAIPMMSGGIGNILLTERHAMLVEHRQVERPPNGLGDLTSALFLSRHMSGETDEKALQMSVASVFEVLARAVRRGSDELMLAEDYQSFLTPMAMVQTRHLQHPSRRVPGN